MGNAGEVTVGKCGQMNKSFSKSSKSLITDISYVKGLIWGLVCYGNAWQTVEAMVKTPVFNAVNGWNGCLFFVSNSVKEYVRRSHFS